MALTWSCSAPLDLPILGAVAAGEEDGFVRWQARIQSFLEANKLWPYVSGEILRPSETFLQEPNPAFEVWFTQDRFAIGWLLSTISDSVLESVLHLQTSKEVWDLLDHLHITTSDSGEDRQASVSVVAEEEECDHIVKKVKECCIIPWKQLEICGFHDRNKWHRISVEGRSEKFACLKSSSQLDLVGKLANTKHLAPRTTYGVTLLFKLQTPNKGLGHPFLEATISFATLGSKKLVCLEHPPPPEASSNDDVAVEIAHEREDGWLGIMLGEFTNLDGRQGSVTVHLYGKNKFVSGYSYEGLVVDAIEFKPLN